jgi:hypothetical protein
MYAFVKTLGQGRHPLFPWLRRVYDMPAGLVITIISVYYTPPPPHAPLILTPLSADTNLTSLYLLLHMVMHNHVHWPA